MVAEAEAQSRLTLVPRACASADPWEVASGYLVLGYPRLVAADIAAADREFAGAARFPVTRRTVGTGYGAGIVAGLASFRGEHARAVDLADEALTLLDELGAIEQRCDLSCDRGDYRVRHAVATGADPSIARADYDEAARLADRAGLPAYPATASRGLADIAFLLVTWPLPGSTVRAGPGPRRRSWTRSAITGRYCWAWPASRPRTTGAGPVALPASDRACAATGALCLVARAIERSPASN